MYIESVDLGLNLNGTDFMDMLQVQFQSDGGDNEVEELYGDYQGIVGSLDYNYAGGENSHYSIDRLIANSASLVYRSEDEYSRMFSYDAVTYKTVASSFIIGALVDRDSLNIKTYLLAEIINFFLGVSPITSVKEPPSATNFNTVCYPNPFTDLVVIEFEIAERSQVQVKILDEMGRPVATIASCEFTAGVYQIKWDGTNNSGIRVENGVYFYRIATTGKTETGKILFVK